jgi:hypothetical protein
MKPSNRKPKPVGKRSIPPYAPVDRHLIRGNDNPPATRPKPSIAPVGHNPNPPPEHRIYRTIEQDAADGHPEAFGGSDFPDGGPTISHSEVFASKGEDYRDLVRSQNLLLSLKELIDLYAEVESALAWRLISMSLVVPANYLEVVSRARAAIQAVEGKALP